MSPYGAEMFATVAAVTGDELALTVRGREATEPDSEVEASVTIDGTAGAMARPRTVAPQVIGFEIQVDGTVLPIDVMTNKWNVSRSYDDRLQQWSFEVALEDPTGPLGSPFDTIGPPLAKRKVDVFGVYQTSTGVHRVRLIKDGIADNSSRRGGASGHFEPHRGVDRGGRYDRKTATLVLPPGHGLPRGLVIRELAKSAGEMQVRIDAGRSCYKEIQVVDGDWLSVSAELVEVEGRRLFWDRDGYLANPEVGRPVGSVIAQSFEEKDCLDIADVTLSHRADVPTDVTLTGTEQITTDEAECGLTPSRTETESFSLTAPVRPAYVQSTGGTYSSNPAAPTLTTPMRIRLIIAEQEVRCGTIVHEKVTTYEWVNPARGRYTWDAVTPEWDPLACYTDENTAGSGPAWAFTAPRWAIVSISETWHYYNKVGFRRSNTPTEGALDGYPWLARIGTELDGTEASPQAGYYLGSLTRQSAYYAPRAAVKSRFATPPLTVWESVNYVSGLNIFGGGEAWDISPIEPWSVAGSLQALAIGEALIGVSEEVTNHVAGDDGYMQRVDTFRRGWAKRDGANTTNLYGDGTESPEGEESFRLVESGVLAYIPTDEGSHKEVSATYGLDGKLIAGEEKRGLQGYPPGINRIEVPETNTAAYETGEQDAYAKSAKRSQTKQIKVQVIATALELTHEKGIIKTEVPWAESEDELEEIARRMIEDGSAAGVTFTLAGNFFVEPCQVVHLAYRPLGIDHDVRVRAVSWSGPEPVTTQVEGLIYGW